MKRSDFKKVIRAHLIICIKIVEHKTCGTISCDNCPFSNDNTTQKKYCTDVYRNGSIGVMPGNVDPKLVASAVEFLETFASLDNTLDNTPEEINRICWDDTYKTKLCIDHHLRECTRKYDFYVDIEAKLKVSGGYSSQKAKEGKCLAAKELDKELMDLYLLLESYAVQKDLTSLIANRITRFGEKAQESAQER